MLVHVVLFRPRAGLAPEDRENLLAAIERAHSAIPVIRRFVLGCRTARHAGYAAAMPDYPFLALIELDDETALQAYLAHPSHAEMARLFWTTGESPLAYDFEVVDFDRLRSAMGG